jgi:hypothetical protein
VTKSSGSGTPSGVVVFEDASSGTPAGNPPAVNILTGNAPSNPATLSSSGTFSVNTAFLPAGNYSLKAHYGGDTVFAPSDSAPVSVTLSQQASKVVVSFVTFTNAAVSAISTSAQSVPYGSNYTLRVDVENAAGTPCQNVSTGTVAFICPTGKITLLDNGSALNDFPNAQATNATNVANLNDRGFIEDQPIQLSVGTHPITATYTAAATSSYTSQASSNTLSVAITQAATTTAVTSSVASVASGGTVTLTAVVSTNSNSAVGPSGTVQFLNGSTNLGTAAATCKSTGATSTTSASCTATLTTALSALPPGIINVRPPTTPFVFLAWLATALALIAFMLSMMLATKRKQYAYAGATFFLITATVLAGCGGSSNTSSSGSTRSITAKYSGDTNYAGSTGSTTITVH